MNDSAQNRLGRLPEILRDRSAREILELIESDDIRELVAVIGEEATLRLLAECGGQNLYVPKLDEAIRQVRNRAIRAEFDGKNIPELARRYGLGESAVYKILGGRRRRNGDGNDGRQSSLF